MLDLFLQSILGGSLVKQPMEICKGMWPIENLEGGRIVVMDIWKKFSGMFGWLQDKTFILRKQLWEMLLFENICIQSKHLILKSILKVLSINGT